MLQQVEIFQGLSQEELEALQEAANNNANFGQDEEVKIQDDFMVNKA